MLSQARMQKGTTMIGSNQYTHKYSVCRMALICLAAILLAVGPSIAASREGGVQPPSAKVTIEKKTLAVVITNIGDRYSVSEETIIADAKGRQISIRDLLVPCEAEVNFITEGGVRKAEFIKILQIGRNASWRWFSESPD
jgi:hypothetical protein